MNLLTRIMSYDKTKIKNQENCNCEECVSVENAELKNQTVEYPKLSEKEIEQIINERYFNKDEKTKTFIRKALRKHGDRYDYSKVLYIHNKMKVEIICRIEGHYSFMQRPNDHLRNHGCPKCGTKSTHEKQKLTLEEFIEKANEVHGVGTYDYSESIYVSYHEKIKIICPKHGGFWQDVSSHLQGEGCPKCGNEKCSEKLKMTLEEFKEFANETHGVATYDYSESEYVNSKTPIKIICPKHGAFWQIAHNHLQGQGCPSCRYEKLANLYRLTLEEFIERANEVQGEGSYDYSKSEYINCDTPLKIICPKHGIFYQTPYRHLKGEGCPKCTNKYKGEIAVRNFLIEYKIEFDEQKRFKDCRNKLPLPFDFYLPKYNLCIEYDGLQHFEPHDFTSKLNEEEKLENFKMSQIRDQIKNDYCKNNDIGLLRIRYDENVKEKLTEYFKEYNIL